jgi:hypothetical protein
LDAAIDYVEDVADVLRRLPLLLGALGHVFGEFAAGPI